MLDLKFILKNSKEIQQAAKNKNIDLDVKELLEIIRQRKKITQKLNELQAQRNKLAKKAKGKKPSQEQMRQGRELKAQITGQQKVFSKKDQKFQELMVKVPVIPSVDTPIGKDESSNKEISRFGQPAKFSFKPKDYLQLAKDLDLIDFQRGVKVAGYRGYFMKNQAVMLQIGLMMFALKKLIQKGFTPFIPPTLVREFVLFGSGYFAAKNYNPATDEVYQIANQDKKADGREEKEKKFLIGTAEPSLLAYYSGEVLEQKDLPLKICGFSQCYRSEIGSYGKDTRGIYRVHEFMKVEQVCLCPADIEKSNQLMDEMLEISREIHQELGLAFRQIQICTGDMSPGKYKMFDLEAWIPSRKSWGETGSASNFLDWQARRLNVRYKNKKGDKKFVYMLNNTALASPRTIIAILENNQRSDGSIMVPEVLREYVGSETIQRVKA